MVSLLSDEKMAPKLNKNLLVLGLDGIWKSNQ
jgi:hypothetical protein